jgi:hypothetical protein
MVEVILSDFSSLMSEEEAKLIGDVFLRGFEQPECLPGMPDCATSLELV